MRLENTWQEIRDHCFIQNHSRPFRFPALCWCFSSSVHPTNFLPGSGQITGMAIAEAWFCAQWPIFVLFWSLCLNYWPVERSKHSQSITYFTDTLHLLIFFISTRLILQVSPNWSSSHAWQLNILEFVFGWARIIFLETLLNNMWWCRCCLTISFFRISDPETQVFSAILQLWSLESLSHSNSPSRRALGRYRQHTSSFRQFHNLLC